MKNRIYITVISLLSVLFSTQVLAHNFESGRTYFGKLLHNFTGEHVVMLVVVGVCAVGVTQLLRRFR